MKRLRMFVGALLVCGSAVVLFAVPSALASGGKPTIQRIPVDSTTVDTVCGFPVQSHVTGTILDISSTDAQGVVHDFQANPQGTETFTNLLTGKMLTVIISGPGTYTVNPDGSFTLVGTGLWTWLVDPDTGLPGEFLTQGRFVLSFDASGNGTLISRTGTKTDLCAQLR
jgi:hypothetical protein